MEVYSKFGPVVSRIPIAAKKQGQMATQMQVVVPAGVGPGMPFQVNTPTGPMQVVCPPGVAAGSPITINVPANVPVAVAQPMVVAAQPIGAVAAESGLMMGTAVDVPQASAPVPQGMNRQSEMDNRMHEVSSGCYGTEKMPCCYMTYLAISPEGIRAGPCWCCIVCLCPCPPGMCGVFKPTAPGSGTFKGEDGALWTFTSNKHYVMNGGMGSSKDESMVRLC